MEFDIDVSGEDLLNKDSTICIADKDGIIKGFKFTGNLAEVINSRYGQDFYHYTKSKNGRAVLKIRI